MIPKITTFTNILFVLFFGTISATLKAQELLPAGFSKNELLEIQKSDWQEPFYDISGSITAAPSGPVRNYAQWEEMQALTITWTSYPSVLSEIVRSARLEVNVYIICGPSCTGSTDSNSVKNYLTNAGIALTNVAFIYAPCNAVWTRDYSSNSCYINDVDSLIQVDWKYNRPTRRNDDTLPRSLCRALNIPLYETTLAPNDLIHTGGNYMTDGLGTAFSSELVLDENPTKSEAQIDAIMQSFMGINRYIKMPTLPFDGIHHIDMHMKLLNEETLLVGQYPPGVADGPQIEANLAYILANFNSVFGTPYKVIRIPMPPDQLNNYIYPNSGGNYLTYTNATIINKTVLVPQFYAQYDTTALRIWREAMPGYNIVGINSNSTISASGSIHCITHGVGVQDPLLIVHQNLPDTYNSSTAYQVDARVQHKSGIQYATLYHTADTTLGYSNVAMALTNGANNTWTGYMPAYPAGTHVFYYIKAASNSGKEQVRPMPAPHGNFEFDVLGNAAGINDIGQVEFKPAYPNPSHGITCIPLAFHKNSSGSIRLLDILGQEVSVIYNGDFQAGEKNFFLNSLNLSAGTYLIVLESTEGRFVQKLMVR